MKSKSLRPLDDSVELAIQQRLRSWEHLIIGALVALGVLNVTAGYLFIAEVEERAVSAARTIAKSTSQGIVQSMATKAMETAERHRERIEELSERVGEVSSGVSALEVVRYELESLSQAQSEIEELRQVHALLAKNTKNLEGLANYLAENPQFHDAVICAAMRSADRASANLNTRCGGDI